MSSNIGYQILQAVKRRVEALNLDDVRDIQLQTKPLTDEQIRPGAYITPPTKGNGSWETFPKKTNERQIVGYGCQITVVHGSLGEWNGAPDQVMDWRQTVRRKFNDNGLQTDTYEITDSGYHFYGPPKVSEADYEFSDPDVEKDRMTNVDITALVVRVFVLEPRSG
jgi:hypothetical protein